MACTMASRKVWPTAYLRICFVQLSSDMIALMMHGTVGKYA